MSADLCVVCLCADWCHVCRGMQTTFEQMPERMPEVKWRWLDIEDHDEWLGDLDITTFPTYFIASKKGVHLLAPGPTTAEALTRFVRPYLRPGVETMATAPSVQPLLDWVDTGVWPHVLPNKGR